MKINITNKYGEDQEIDTTTAKIQEINEAYTYLNMKADNGGAFPGSHAWQQAKKYGDTLAALIADRPEIEAYRASLRNRPIGWNKANNI